MTGQLVGYTLASEPRIETQKSAERGVRRWREWAILSAVACSAG